MHRIYFGAYLTKNMPKRNKICCFAVTNPDNKPNISILKRNVCCIFEYLV